MRKSYKQKEPFQRQLLKEIRSFGFGFTSLRMTGVSARQDKPGQASNPHKMPK